MPNYYLCTVPLKMNHGFNFLINCYYYTLHLQKVKNYFGKTKIHKQYIRAATISVTSLYSIFYCKYCIYQKSSYTS